MIRELEQLLKSLEHALDPASQQKTDRLYKKSLSWEDVPRLPIIFTYPLPQDSPFKPFPFSQVFDNHEKMLYNELVYVFNTSIACRYKIYDDLPFAVRANFGTVIIASMLGGKVEQIGENPPWVRSFEDIAKLEKILDCDPSDFSTGLCPKVVETYKLYQQILSNFPILQQSIKIVLPDLQGPFDSAELLRGSKIYEDLYVNVGMLQKVLRHIAEAQVNFAKSLQPYLSDGPEGFSHQHRAMIKGNILIRDDCTINISPKTYREHVALHDTFVLDAMNGGGIHCCAKFEHLVEEFLALSSIKCIDLGQSEKNNVDAIYMEARQYKIPLIRVQAGEEELATGCIIDRFPTGVTLIHNAESLEKAQYVMTAYEDAARQRPNTWH